MTIITKIHGKSYDLTNFKHPGGSIPLHLINGRDGTCLFESYHPVSNRDLLRKILDKYEIEDSDIEEQKIYDFNNFENNLFVKELREEVYNYFKDLSIKNNCSIIESTKINNFKIFENFILLNILCHLIYNFYFNNIIGVSFVIFFYWIFAVNNWHDCSHFSMLTNNFLENIIYRSIYIFDYINGKWLIKHTYYHHSYTNIINLDNDLNLYIEKTNSNNFNTKINNSIYTKFCKKYFYIKIKKIYRNFINYIYVIKEDSKNIINIISKLIFTYSFFIYNFNRYNIFYLLFITIFQIVLISFLFLIFTQVNHIHTVNFTNNKNFYIHQIEASNNINTQSKILTILSGGLNCQIEHHLFPSVNSCHLQNLAKIIKPLCKKYNIKYNESNSFFSSLYDTIKTTKIFNNNTINNYNFRIFK